MAKDVPEKILYVEDEADIQEIARMALETFGGFAVKTCSSGAEALREAPGYQADLILLDVMMPEMDGPSTMIELRKMPEIKDCPIIFLTARVQKQEVERYMELGALGVIYKPFDAMTLSDEIKEIWKKAHA